LEVEAQEKEVGPFRADILCKDTANNSWVLIENQLEKTDHVHLGQLITYAAGLDTVTIVWIAHRFTEEHRAALDWLNEVTDERINFFGLEIELLRIGDSPVAPRFNVVCKPNAWTRSVTGGAAAAANSSLSDTKRLQLEYWTAFRQHLDDCGSALKTTKPAAQHWMNVAIGRSGFRLGAVASFWDAESGTFDGNHSLRAELLIETEHSKEHFALLRASEVQITTEFGAPLEWESPAETRRCRILVRKRVDLRDRASWPDQHEWLRDRLERLYKVFAPRVRTLPSEPQIAT
jgi:hypothetical protein